MNLKNTLNSALVSLLLAFSWSLPAAAEQESFIVSGIAHSYSHWPNGVKQTYYAVLFEAEITYDNESPLRYFLSGEENYHWYDQSLSFDLSVYDLSGGLIDHQVIGPVSVPTSNYFPAAYVFSDGAGNIDRFGFKIPLRNGVTDFEARMAWTPAAPIAFSADYPSWEWGLEPGSGNTFSMSRGGSVKVDGDFQFTGFVSSFGSGDDTDGDGVPQGSDACPDSDMRPTIIFNGFDSGVENTVDDSGCSLADRLSGSAGDARNHGQLVRATSQFLTDLLREGVITNKERSALLSAVAQSNK